MIYEKIKTLCGEKNISVAQLERKASIANGTIARWKRVSPSSESLMKVADFFSISVDFLLGRAETSPQGQELANIYDSLPTPKQDLVKKYVEMMQDGT